MRLVFCVLVLFCGNFLCAAETAQRPNIIVVLTDDQGAGDVGIVGNEKIHTPNIDRFARDGIHLKRFYANQVCAPTRASLMTGRYYYRTGVIHTSRGGAKMHSDEVTMAEYLRQAGYATGIFGKWHLGDTYPMRPQDQGFDESLVHKAGGIDQAPDKPNFYQDPKLWRNGEAVQAKGYCTDVFFDEAMQFIEQHREKPFFVYIPTNVPHTPLQIDDEAVKPYRDLGLNDTTARIYAMVANLDVNFGRLLARLDQWKLREKTLIWFFADNGPQQQRFNDGLRGRKAQIYEGGIRVLSFVQWPGRFPGGRQIDVPCAHIDLLPTFLELAAPNVSPRKPLDGSSLVNLLQGDAAGSPERSLFFQVHRGLKPQRYHNCAVITSKYKLVGFPGTFSKEEVPVGGANGIQWELYDLQDDRAEKLDLAGKMSDRVARLKSQYDRWFDSVEAERHFTPGVIHIGNPAENPLVLCRYQDCTFRDRKPDGWSVEIEKAGRYRLTINRGESRSPSRMLVRWQGTTQEQPLAANGNTAEFTLSAGTGVLDIWFQEPGHPRIPISDNSTLGDVTIELLGP